MYIRCVQTFHKFGQQVVTMHDQLNGPFGNRIILLSMEWFPLKKNYKHDWSFLLQNPQSRFFIFATHKLWNYSVQVFLVQFLSFLLPTDCWNQTLLVYVYLYLDWIRRFTPNFCIQSKYRKICTRKNSVFGHFHAVNESP